VWAETFRLVGTTGSRGGLRLHLTSYDARSLIQHQYKLGPWQQSYRTKLAAIVRAFRSGVFVRSGSLLSTSLLAAALTIPFVTLANAAIVVSIDKTTQQMSVSVDGTPRYLWPVSTGRPGYDTPNGTFKANRMDANHLSQEWDNAPMPHTIFFDMHGHAIHGFFDLKHLGRAVSHGCVRLSPNHAATLFALIEAQGMKETTVIVSGQTPAGGGQEIGRRRAPTQEAAAQPLQVAPGYDGQPQVQQYYRQPPQPGYGQPQYYRQAQPQPYYDQLQPYYAQQQQQSYYPSQPPQVVLFRPLGQ
jgi:hypothetical protein